MSRRNGDKARFDRQQKKKTLHRERIRELRKRLELESKATLVSTELSKKQKALDGPPSS